LQFLGVVGLAGFLVIFPDGRFVPRWALPVAAVWALWVGMGSFFPDSPFDSGTWPAAASLGAWALFLSAFVCAQVYRYRRVSTSAQRIQTKWVVFGFAAAALGYFGGTLVFAVTTTPKPTVSAVTGDLVGHTLIFAGFLAIPSTIAIAMLRYRLFDVDLLIRRALVYAALAATLAVLYESGAILLEQMLLALTGGTGRAETVLAFAVGALTGPLQQRIDRDITRLIYPRRYMAERRIEAFGWRLRREWEVEPLTEEWEDAVEERLGRIWARVRSRPTRAGAYIQGRLFP
jgi:hypothetical protein